MKKILLVLLGMTLLAHATDWASTGLVFGGNAADEARRQQQIDLVNAASQKFIPWDPWRVLQHQTNFAKGTQWVQFYGKSFLTNDGKVFFYGWCGEPLAYNLPGFSTQNLRTFCVTNFPYHTSAVLPSQNLTAFDPHQSANFTSVANGKEYCPLLDYGTVLKSNFTTNSSH